MSCIICFDKICTCPKKSNKSTFYAHLGAKIRGLRKDMGLSQKEFSKMTEIDQTTISRMERAVHRPTMWDLFKISRECNISINDMVPKYLLYPKAVKENDENKYKPSFLNWAASYEDEVSQLKELISGNPGDVKMLKAEYQELTGRRYRSVF